MKVFFAVIFCAWSFSVYAVENQFTIDYLGVSNNTATLFLEVIENVSGTTCSDPNSFRVSVSDPNVDRFLSILMSAQAQGLPVFINYDVSQCLSGGTVMNVIKLKTQ